MTKTISELTREELTKVFHANSKLREEIQDDMQDSEMLFIGDWFNRLEKYLKSYSYGICDRNEHITVKEDSRRDFLEMLKIQNDDYLILRDEYLPILKKALHYCDIMDKYNLYNDKYYKFDEKLDILINELTREILKNINNNLESSWDSENQLSYFLEFYVDSRMDDINYQVSDDFELIEMIRKSYK